MCGIFSHGFPAFCRLFGYKIFYFPRNREILETLGSWESFRLSRLFGHKEKPGKRRILFGAFYAFPGFSGWLAFKETAECWKA